MAAGTALLCSTLLVVLVFVSADPKIITAESGQDVTLTCRAPSNNNTGATWIKDDFWTEYVFWNQDSHFHPDGQFVPDNQDPSFKNRVDLQDRQMKDGDVSLILKDVTINDTGTYQCRVFMEETFSWALISSINLRVIRHEEHTIVLLSVLLPVVDLLVLLVLLMRRCVHRKLEADGEDDITSSITYSVGKSSTTSRQEIQRQRD